MVLERVKTLGDVGMGLMYFVHEKYVNWGVCKRRLLWVELCAPSKKKKKKPHVEDFPGGVRGKEFACQCRRCRRREFDPWVRKIP